MNCFQYQFIILDKSIHSIITKEIVYTNEPRHIIFLLQNIMMIKLFILPILLRLFVIQIVQLFKHYETNSS
jgi:hypothetical protein